MRPNPRFGPDARNPTRGKFSDAWRGIGPPATRRFRLYLPLHNALGNGSVSVNAGASLAPTAPAQKAPCVWVGGKVAMGAYVSRAGWAFPSVGPGPPERLSVLSVS
jgi:hypothetical protein